MYEYVTAAFVRWTQYYMCCDIINAYYCGKAYAYHGNIRIYLYLLLDQIKAYRPDLIVYTRRRLESIVVASSVDEMTQLLVWL